MKQHPERFGQLSADSVLVVDQQLDEERLIEPATKLRPGCLVGRVAVLHQRECLIELGDDGVVAQFASSEQSLGLLEFTADPVLLAFEEVEGDGIGVVGLENLLSLVSELLDSPLEPRSFFSGIATLPVQLIEDEGLDLACTTRSRAVGMPSVRSLPFALGIIRVYL